jgi:hypothetical protein
VDRPYVDLHALRVRDADHAHLGSQRRALLGDFQIVADTNSSWTSAPGPEMSKLVTVVPDLAEPAHIQRCRCPAAEGAERAACSVCGQPLVEMDQLTVLAPVTCGTDRGANEPRF